MPLPSCSNYISSPFNCFICAACFMPNYDWGEYKQGKCFERYFCSVPPFILLTSCQDQDFELYNMKPVYDATLSLVLGNIIINIKHLKTFCFDITQSFNMSKCLLPELLFLLCELVNGSFSKQVMFPFTLLSGQGSHGAVMGECATVCCPCQRADPFRYAFNPTEKLRLIINHFCAGLTAADLQKTISITAERSTTRTQPIQRHKNRMWAPAPNSLVDVRPAPDRFALQPFAGACFHPNQMFFEEHGRQCSLSIKNASGEL